MRILLFGVGAVLAAYFLVLTGLYTLQRRLLFVPDTTPPDPMRAGLDEVAVLRLPTEDGLALAAWYVSPADPDGFTVLLLHGNAGNIGHRANRLRRMQGVGWGVLLLEYRGYGGNAGSPTEDGLTLDARAGLAELVRRAVPPERTLLWGESLGTGLAIRLAAENKVAAVLLDAPYTSIVDAAQGQYPYVPVRPLLKDKFDSLSRVAAIQAPIFVMQGSADRLVPPSMGRKLMQAATAPTELWVADGAGHEDLGPYGAVEAAAAFVAKWCPLQPRHDQK